MARRRKTAEQIKSQLDRIYKSIEEKDPEYPHLPRGKYALSQQLSYVKTHPRTLDTTRGIGRMVDYGDDMESKRASQAREAANRLLSKASGGQG